MNEALQVTTFYEGYGSKVMKVDGFSDEDLDNLRRMDYRDMIQQVLEALDKAKKRLDANVNPDLVMELLFLSMKENG